MSEGPEGSLELSGAHGLLEDDFDDSFSVITTASKDRIFSYRGAEPITLRDFNTIHSFDLEKGSTLKVVERDHERPHDAYTVRVLKPDGQYVNAVIEKNDLRKIINDIERRQDRLHVADSDLGSKKPDGLNVERAKAIIQNGEFRSGDSPFKRIELFRNAVSICLKGGGKMPSKILDVLNMKTHLAYYLRMAAGLSWKEEVDSEHENPQP